MLEDNSWISSALDVLEDGAINCTPEAVNIPPRHNFEAKSGTETEKPLPRKRGRPRKLPTGSMLSPSITMSAAPIKRPRGRPRKVQPEFDQGQSTPAYPGALVDPDPTRDHKYSDALRKSVAGGEPIKAETPASNVPDGTLGTIVEQHRRRWDMIRARQRLELQGMSVCRRLCAGDKTAGAKLWLEVAKDDSHHLRGWLGPYFAAAGPLRSAQDEIEKGLVKLVRQLPVYPWVKEVKGLGDISFAAIVGECATAIGDYKSVAAVWKRMGLAVIGDIRQRKVAGDAAIEHGYSPQRRAIMWNIGAGLIKAQVRKHPDDDDQRVGIGPYGALYIERKAFEATKVESKAHAHNRAQRYIEKRLLRDLFRAWREADGHADPEPTA